MDCIILKDVYKFMSASVYTKVDFPNPVTFLNVVMV